MLIRFEGARGSIPVSGGEYLRYGGDTTCLEIRTDDGEVVIIDAGSGIRRLGNRLVGEDRRRFSMIFTHSHWDHILGFPFFRPIYMKGTEIDLYGCPFAQEFVRKMLAGTMEAPHFPVQYDDFQADINYGNDCAEPFSIGSMLIEPILLSHPNQGIGYRFSENGRSFVFLTDNELTYVHPGGLAYEDYVAFCRGADLLVHDAEFTAEEYELTRGWGHTVYTDALRLTLDADVARFGLTHHNQDRPDDDVEAFVEDCRRIAGEAGASVDCFGVCQGMEIEL